MLIENRTFSALIGLVIAFAIGTVSSYFLLQPSAETLVLTNAEVNQLKIAYKQLKIENSDLKRQLQTVKTPLDITVPSSPNQLNEIASFPTSVDNQVKAEPPEDIQVGVVSSSITEKIQLNPEFNLTAELANKFANEEVDMTWAIQQENVIRDLFLDNLELANILPDSIECKSLRCRIRIALVDLEDGNQSSMSFASAIASTPQLSQLSIVSGFDYEHAALEIYLPRNPDVNLLQ